MSEITSVRRCSQPALFELPETEIPPALFEVPDAPMTRRCGSCGVTRPIDMFYTASEKRAALRLGRRRVTIDCRLCARERKHAAMKPRRDYIDAVKLANGCADCGLKSPHPAVYDFDHLPQFQKKWNIGVFCHRGTMDELIAEIAKCEVVCSNCHRIRTTSRPSNNLGNSWADVEGATDRRRMLRLLRGTPHQAAVQAT